MLTSCGCKHCNIAKNAEEKDICQTAYSYIIATGNYKIDEAVPYASKDTREVTLPFIKDNILPHVDSTFLAKSVPATATIDTILLMDDTAYVGYTKTTPLGATQGTLTLVKEDGKWLAYVPLMLPNRIAIPVPQDNNTGDAQ